VPIDPDPDHEVRSRNPQSRGPVLKPTIHSPNHLHLHSPSLLTARGSNLLWSTLRTLLALNPTDLSLRCTRRVLRLLSLLCTLSRGSLLLALLDCGLSGSGAGFRAHRSSLLDHIEGGTDDGSLGLDCAAGSLLRDFLRDTLLVLSSEENGPCDTAGVLALEEKRLGLAVLETEDLAVATDVELALSRVDLLAREGAFSSDDFLREGEVVFLPKILAKKPPGDEEDEPETGDRLFSPGLSTGGRPEMVTCLR